MTWRGPFIFREVVRRQALPDSTSRPIFPLRGLESLDNFAPLLSLAEQIHIYGEGEAAGKTDVSRRFPWNEEMGRKGLRENAAYRVRPDGYIGRVLRLRPVSR